MSPGHMLPGQNISGLLGSVKDVPRKLPVKFGQNRISNSSDISNMNKCHQGKYGLDKCQSDRSKKAPVQHLDSKRNEEGYGFLITYSFLGIIFS